jgi:LPXTG-site transpeptidase (sortase) family protein
MTGNSLLRFVERGLLGVGAALAVWCAVILMQARFTQELPVPEPTLVITQTLPGDAGAAAVGTGGSTSSATRRTAPAPAVGSWLARLDAPSVKLTTTVLEGSDDATLARGSGHLEDTPLPGERGNMGIAGHRDTVFRPLRHVNVGDPMVLTTSDRVYRYRISKTLIVQPEDVYVLDPTPQPTLTLITCYPFGFVGHAPQRFIVQAELVEETAR